MTLRRVLPVAEDHVPTDRVSQRAHGPRRLLRARVGVNSDAAEVLPETRLHKLSRGRVQRLTRRMQCFVDKRRRDALRRVVHLSRHGLRAFVRALLILTFGASAATRTVAL